MTYKPDKRLKLREANITNPNPQPTLSVHLEPYAPVSLITSIRTAAAYPSLHEIHGRGVGGVASMFHCFIRSLGVCSAVVTELSIFTVLRFAM